MSFIPGNSGQPWSWASSPLEVTLNTATNYYLNGNIAYSSGTPSWYGAIVAVRLA